MAKEKIAFEADVTRLLDIVARSLYSDKEIFLRELISNASDACDRLRYAALTKAKLTEGSGAFQITLMVDSKRRLLSVADNGIGMNRKEVGSNLGTIARSGTQAFADKLTGDAGKDMALIGQFGVGFYSAFIVADKVEVLTRKAGERKAWLWTSDGKGAYTIDEAEREAAGTTVTLTLGKDEGEFLEKARLAHIVKTYSDHIAIPIVFKDGENEESLNTAGALWTRQKKDITDDQFKEFYHHVAHAFDDPWMVIFNRVEGILSYTNLLFIPTARPFDLFDAERKHRVKLYVNRIFITNEAEELLPGYLRFLRGIVDTEDLPLNISRETLQQDPKLSKIRSGLVKRVLGELKKKAAKAPDDYAQFWDTFGAVLKEGIYEDIANRDALVALARFRTTAGDELVSLEDYVGRMKEGQDAIYTITGENAETLAQSPQLEGFRARGIEVLLLTDPIDEFWPPAVGSYKDKPLKSATQGAPDLKSLDGDDKDKDKDNDDAGCERLIGLFRATLGDAVKDVRPSMRLTDSAVCLVADDGDMDMHMERMLKRHQPEGAQATPRILEINPRHSLIRRLGKLADASKGEDKAADDRIREAAELLLDQARIIEGEPIANPADFSRRMAGMMERGLEV